MRFISCVKCFLSLLLNTEAFSDQLLFVFSSFFALFSRLETLKSQKSWDSESRAGKSSEKLK